MIDDKKFIEKFNQDFVCVKLIDPNGGWPLNYGVILKEDNTKIFLRDRETHQVTTDFVAYNSIDEMLNAGWRVD